MTRLRIATYNTHRSRGMDWKIRPERIAQVLHLLNADLIALQEVFEDQVPHLTDSLDFSFVFGRAEKTLGREYGNLVLSRFPITRSQNLDVSIERREMRRCLRTDITLPCGQMLHFFAVHLGTSFFERRRQAARLLSTEILNSPDLSGPRIVTGDFNEWTRGLLSRSLREELHSAEPHHHLGRRRTYPGIVPFLHLDHIYYDPPLRLTKMSLHRTPAALLASDHLPLVGDFELV